MMFIGNCDMTSCTTLRFGEAEFDVFTPKLSTVADAVAAAAAACGRAADVLVVDALEA